MRQLWLLGVWARPKNQTQHFLELRLWRLVLPVGSTFLSGKCRAGEPQDEFRVIVFGCLDVDVRVS